MESSLFVGIQCLWLSWVTHVHEFTCISPWTYIQAFVFKYLFKLSLPTKLRLYNEESFGYPQTLPPPPPPWMKMIPHHNLVVQVQSYEFDSKNGNTFNNNFRDFICWDFLMIIRIIFVTCFYNCIFLCLRYTVKFCKKK